MVPLCSNSYRFLQGILQSLCLLKSTRSLSCITKTKTCCGFLSSLLSALSTTRNFSSKGLLTSYMVSFGLMLVNIWEQARCQHLQQISTSDFRGMFYRFTSPLPVTALSWIQLFLFCQWLKQSFQLLQTIQGTGLTSCISVTEFKLHGIREDSSVQYQGLPYSRHTTMLKSGTSPSFHQKPITKSQGPSLTSDRKKYYYPCFREGGIIQADSLASDTFTKMAITSTQADTPPSQCVLTAAPQLWATSRCWPSEQEVWTLCLLPVAFFPKGGQNPSTHHLNYSEDSSHSLCRVP